MGGTRVCGPFKFFQKSQDMENVQLIKYKYEAGAYSKEDLVNMVPDQLSEKDFFVVTRCFYQAIKNSLSSN